MQKKSTKNRNNPQEKSSSSINAPPDISAALENNFADSSGMKIDSFLKQLTVSFLNSSEGIGIVDNRKTLIFANEAFAALHGYSIDEIIHKHISVLHTPEQMCLVNKIIDNFAPDSGFLGEVPHKRKDGSVFPAIMRITPFYDENNSLVGLIGSMRDISKRKQTETKLKESEERFRSLYENSTIGIYRTNPEGEILHANPALINMLGYDSLEHLQSRNLQISGFEPDYPRASFKNRIAEEGSIKGLESVWTRKDGKRLYIRESAVAVKNPDGEIIFYDGTVEDISDRISAEIKLAESEKNYRILAENSSDVVFKIDLGLKLQYLSPAIETITGYSIDEMMRMDFSRLLTPGSFQRVLEVNRNWIIAEKNCPGEKTVQQVEVELTKKDGSHCWFDIFVSPVWDDNNKIASITGSARDITARITAEKSLRRSYDILHAVSFLADKFLRENFSNIDFTVVMNEIGKTISGECVFVHKFESDQTNFNNRPYFIWLNPENARKSDELIIDALIEYTDWSSRLKSQTSIMLNEADAVSIDYKAVVKLGVKSLLFIPIFLGQKYWGFLGIVYFSRNHNWLPAEVEALITASDIIGAALQRNHSDEERKRLETKINQTQRLESLGVLAGGIAHDFNNLLQSILGNNNLAMMDLPRDSVVKDYLNHIDIAVKKAAKLTQQMLVYSGKANLMMEKVNLSEHIAGFRQLIESGIPKKARVYFDLDPEIPLIEADSIQLRQIVLNLATNASEAVDDDNGEIIISTGSRYCDKDYLRNFIVDDSIEEGEFVFLEVKDNGCGMDKAKLDKIFDPFFSSKFTGRGLGMAAVLGIIRSMNGAISIDSAPEKGSLCKILFPTAPSNFTGAEILPPSQEEWFGKGIALIVDKEEIVRTVSRRILEKLGFRVTFAHSVEEVTSAIHNPEEPPDLILIDAALPFIETSGIIQKILASDSKFRVILTFGSEHPPFTMDTDRLAYLKKPYRISDIKEMLERMKF